MNLIETILELDLIETLPVCQRADQNTFLLKELVIDCDEDPRIIEGLLRRPSLLQDLYLIIAKIPPTIIVNNDEIYLLLLKEWARETYRLHFHLTLIKCCALDLGTGLSRIDIINKIITLIEFKSPDIENIDLYSLETSLRLLVDCAESFSLQDSLVRNKLMSPAISAINNQLCLLEQSPQSSISFRYIHLERRIYYNFFNSILLNNFQENMLGTLKSMLDNYYCIDTAMLPHLKGIVNPYFGKVLWRFSYAKRMVLDSDDDFENASSILFELISANFSDSIQDVVRLINNPYTSAKLYVYTISNLDANVLRSLALSKWIKKSDSNERVFRYSVLAILRDSRVVRTDPAFE